MKLEKVRKTVWDSLSEFWTQPNQNTNTICCCNYPTKVRQTHSIVASFSTLQARSCRFRSCCQSRRKKKISSNQRSTIHVNDSSHSMERKADFMQINSLSHATYSIANPSRSYVHWFHSFSIPKTVSNLHAQVLTCKGWAQILFT